MICSSLGCCSLPEQLWEALGVLPSSVLDHVLEQVVPPIVGAFAVRTDRFLLGTLVPWYLLSLPSPWSGVVGGLQDIVKFLSSAASPTRCPSGWRSCCCIDHLLLWLGGDLLLVAGRLAVILCSVMLVGLADILASPRGYHLYLRIVVHLGHVLGIHLLLVVEDEMETVSSSAFFSWLSSAAIR